MTAKLATRYTTALATMSDRKERGATALEYVGMIIVAAIIVGAIVSVINADLISGAVQTAVNTILGSGS